MADKTRAATPGSTTASTTAVDHAADLPPGLASPAGVDAEVMDQLSVVLCAAARGGLAGMSSEQALRVVEAAEVVKSWADSVSVDAKR